MSHWVRIDLHVHTRRYSACAECLDPLAIGPYAARAGIDGVVLTDHDTLWAGEELDDLRRAVPGLAIFRGIECSTDQAHVVIVGLEDGRDLRRGMPYEAAIQVATAAGAAAILAHPYRGCDAGVLPVNGISAIEVASTSFTTETAQRSMELARRQKKPMVAASDAHALTRVGWARTVFPRMPESEGELAEMVRGGLGWPEVPHPFAL